MTAPGNSFSKRSPWDCPPGVTEQDLTGRTNREIFAILLGREVSKSEGLRLEAEKERIYRDLFRPHRKLLPGLRRLLGELKTHAVPMALATSAPTSNVDFILDGLKARSFFDTVVDASQITHGKPHPEIFLTAAVRLGAAPRNCVVFEDSILGVKAARRAGMPVIGIATSHCDEELTGTVFTRPDFQEISYQTLHSMAMSPSGGGAGANRPVCPA